MRCSNFTVDCFEIHRHLVVCAKFSTLLMNQFEVPQTNNQGLWGFQTLQSSGSIRPHASNFRICRCSLGQFATESAMKWKSMGWLKTYLCKSSWLAAQTNLYRNEARCMWCKLIVTVIVTVIVIVLLLFLPIIIIIIIITIIITIIIIIVIILILIVVVIICKTLNCCLLVRGAFKSKQSFRVCSIDS